MRWLLPLAALALAACTTTDAALQQPPKLLELTDVGRALRELPPPIRPVPIAVYAFGDLTGQHKPNEAFAEYSRAVTQGPLPMLVKALREAGGGRWFTVIERENVDQLLRERQIVRAVRDEYRQPDGQPLPEVLDPLLYPGVLVMGGVTAFESNTVTAGAGARYMGVGGNGNYRLDSVTVDLRVVSVRNGQVYSTVSASKSIYSILLQSGIFKIFGSNNLLEAEAGFTRNEPTQLAVRQAIEKAVLGMVVEGTLNGLWQFASPAAGGELVRRYLAERDGLIAKADAAPGAATTAPSPAGPASPALLKDERELLRQQPAAEAPATGDFRTGFGPAGPLPSSALENKVQQQRSGVP